MRKSWQVASTSFGFRSRPGAAPAILGLAVYPRLSLGRSPIRTSRRFCPASTAAASGGAPIITPSPAGSLHEVEMVFTDPITTGALDGGAGIDPARWRPRGADRRMRSTQGTPDEDRVTRKLQEGAYRRGNAGDPAQGLQRRLHPSAHELAYRPGPRRRRKDGLCQAEDQRQGDRDRHGLLHARRRRSPNRASRRCLPSSSPTTSPTFLRLPMSGPSRTMRVNHPSIRSCANDENAGRFIPDIAPDDHAWAATPLPPAVFSKEEQTCLAEGIYFEARSESAQGSGRGGAGHSQPRPQPDLPENDLRRRLPEQGLAQPLPVLLRLRHDPRPDLFALALEGRPRKSRIAVTAGKIWLPEVGSATHYHATYVNPGLGKDDEACRQDRPAHLLQDLWRRLELTAKLPARPCQHKHGAAGRDPAARGRPIPAAPLSVSLTGI